MKYNIVPFDSVGSIKLGMSATEIHNLLGAKGLLSSGNDFGEIDVWIDRGIRVSYEGKICTTIECISPAKPYLNGHSLFDFTCLEIFNLFGLTI